MPRLSIVRRRSWLGACGGGKSAGGWQIPLELLLARIMVGEVCNIFSLAIA